MDRAFSSGSSASPPAAPGSPSIGYPTSGNSGTGTPATKPGPYWYYMMTEEIRGVLVAAGLTPSQADVTQLLQALRAAGVFTTQAQFDATTKAATTAFVQQMLGNFQTLTSISGTTTLTAASAGKTLLLAGAGSYTVTLPLASACPAGTALVFAASAASITVSRQGADLIYPNSSGTTGVVLNNGDNLTLVSSGSAWFAVGGTAVLGNALTSFGNSFSTNGYQRLPTGLIIQWGTNTTTAGSVGITLPIAFPNSAFSATANCIGTANNVAVVSALTLTNLTLFSHVGNTGAATATSMFWTAIGR